MDKISYKTWLLKKKNKLKPNHSYMPIKFLKILYIQSFVADNALLQISTQIGKNARRLFTTAKEVLDVLTARFGNLNEEKKGYSSL